MAELNTSAYNKAFAVNPMASDAVVLGRNGNFGIALTDKGLMQMVWDGNNTATKYRMNPLVMVVRIRYKGSNNYDIESMRYNPLGAAYSGTITRNNTGDITFTHNLGNKGVTAYTATYSGYYNGVNVGNQYFGMTLNAQSNTLQVGISDDASRNDANIEINIYDISKY